MIRLRITDDEGKHFDVQAEFTLSIAVNEGKSWFIMSGDDRYLDAGAACTLKFLSQREKLAKALGVMLALDPEGTMGAISEALTFTIKRGGSSGGAESGPGPHAGSEDEPWSRGEGEGE